MVIRTMLIRMTGLGTTLAGGIASTLVAVAVAAAGIGGALAGGSSTDPAAGGEPAGGSSVAAKRADGPRTALVIDASRARDGRELVAPRLRALDAELRLPRTAA